MPLSRKQRVEDEFPLSRSCSLLNEIRNAKEIKDITIEVQNKVLIPVHRIILAARIPSLRAVLRDPLGENNRVLKWSCVPQSLATSIVNYVYTGQLDLTQENVKGVIMFSRMVNLPILEHWGVNFMLNNVDSTNLAVTWDFAKSLNLTSLMETCIPRMKKGFESFIYSDQFVRLPAETLLALLQSDELAVISEEKIVAAIARWICPCEKIGCDKLRLHAPEILKEVQWHLTTLEFRKRLLENYPMFTNNPECARFIVSVEQWICAADEDRSDCPFHHRCRRTRSPQAFFVFGKDENNDRWSVLRFDSRMQNEERVSGMELRYGASYTIVEESIFVIGGQTSQQTGSTRVDEFMVKERRWYQRAPMAIGRQDHAAAIVRVGPVDKVGAEKSLGGIFGGSFEQGNDWSRITSCEFYDVSQDRWHNWPNLREKRNGPAAATIAGDNHIFVFGGYDGRSYLASVEFCQLGSDLQESATSVRTRQFWLPSAQMRHAREYLAAAHFRGRIIAAGGSDGQEPLNVVEMFSSPDDTSPLGQWTELSRMKKSREYPSILTTADAFYVLGSDKESRNTVEILTAPKGSPDFGNDLKAWTWSSKGSVKTLYAIAGAASIRS